MSTLSFADAVAARCKLDVAEVDEVLERHGVVAAPAPPAARRLRVTRIAFSGIKRIDGAVTPFDFDWCTDADGLWGIASDANSAGKTTILQVVLWALRGAPKQLTQTSLAWIEKVDVTFHVAGSAVNVAFQVEDGEPRGAVRIGPAAARDFADGAEFRRLMQGVMFQNLDLEPLSAAQKTKDGGVHAYEDGWTAYTSAFVSDADSNAIIGQATGTDLVQRLLAVFFGLPFASTFSQASARVRVIEATSNQRKTERAALGGRSLDQIESELANVNQRIADRISVDVNARDLAAAEQRFARLQRNVREARMRSEEIADIEQEAKGVRLKAQQALLAAEQDRAASELFKRLQPVCCPRCSHPIGDDRREHESTSRKCSICTEEIAQGDEQARALSITEAKRMIADAQAKEASTAAEARRLRGEIDRLEVERQETARAVESLARLGTAADMATLDRERVRLEALRDVGRILATGDEIDAQAVKILRAAADEAHRRRGDAAKALLEAASAEICTIAKRLGISDLESVNLKLNANVAIRKGGTDTSFSGLSRGEQLRLRIATVIALVRSANAHGVGRHPGLHMIDSPGNEEMQPEDLAKMLEELETMSREIPGIQLFIAMRGVVMAQAVIPEDRLRVGTPLLW